jgi:hypothetical protein
MNQITDTHANETPLDRLIKCGKALGRPLPPPEWDDFARQIDECGLLDGLSTRDVEQVALVLLEDLHGHRDGSAYVVERVERIRSGQRNIAEDAPELDDPEQVATALAGIERLASVAKSGTYPRG